MTAFIDVKVDSVSPVLERGFLSSKWLGQRDSAASAPIPEGVEVTSKWLRNEEANPVPKGVEIVSKWL